MKRIISFLCFLALTVTALGQAPAAPKHHHRGHKPAPQHVRDRLHAESFARNRHRIKHLPTATQAKFDCKDAFNNILPVDDQGSCGDCFMISALDGCSMALARAGILPATEEGRLSGQYGLDCHYNFGGCDGGDEAEVIDFMKTTGFPLTKDYGPYKASGGRCKPITGMPIFKIGNWGYCTPSQEQAVAKTQDMKNTMAQYGPLSVAFDAGECDGYRGGTMTGRGRNVDHAVLNEGWDDEHDNGDGSKGAFIGRNQWGDWGITINGVSGRFWIKYGADSWGTEAIWITAGEAPPIPVPPTPVPPGPIPPVPPAPGTPVTITISINGNPVQVTLTADEVQSVVAQSGAVTISQGMTVGELLNVLDKLRKVPAFTPAPAQPMPAKAPEPVKPAPEVKAVQPLTYVVWVTVNGDGTPPMLTDAGLKTWLKEQGCKWTVISQTSDAYKKYGLDKILGDNAQGPPAVIGYVGETFTRSMLAPYGAETLKLFITGNPRWKTEKTPPQSRLNPDRELPSVVMPGAFYPQQGAR